MKHFDRYFYMLLLMVCSLIVSQCDPFVSYQAFRLKVKNPEQHEHLDKITKELAEIVKNRLEHVDITDCEVQAKRDGNILVQIQQSEKSAINSDRILQLLTTRGRFTLRLEAPEVEYDKVNGPGDNSPAGYEWVPMQEETEKMLLDEEYHLANKHIDHATVRQNRGQSGYKVIIDLNQEGTKTFAKVTREYTGRRIAIVIDGTVYMAPVIQEEITGGMIVISGDFSRETASVLASLLTSRKLPAHISVVSTPTD